MNIHPLTFAFLSQGLVAQVHLFMRLVHSLVSMSAEKNRICVSLKHDHTYSVIGENTSETFNRNETGAKKRHRKRMPVNVQDVLKSYANNREAK